jgi:hypothetical protein
LEEKGMEIQNLPDMKNLDLIQENQNDERIQRRTFLRRLFSLGFLSLTSTTAVFRGLILKLSDLVRNKPNAVNVDNEESLPYPIASSKTLRMRKPIKGGWIIFREARYYKNVKD